MSILRQSMNLVFTHLLDFYGGGVPYLLKFRHRWRMFFEIIDRKKVAKESGVQVDK